MNGSHEYVSTVTSKGQVTVPVEIRRALGLKAQDKLLFRIVDGKVELAPLPMSLADAYGSVPPLTQPEDFSSIRASAREERADRAVKTSQP
ncbi:MAG: AbrB/MazE/SpoVT family DNA-binding domain-containing protein [Caldilineaceae bacterium]|nr:AbrB/MazE/SpoVT family DNA-binding domain-containing protein [Caldilineaceae bacterium]